ncbi:response regulator transcription factor [Nocardioides albidus]|uniref:Response regulator transcription factor n=1 Tax=Nocardioides albidus TaxID=1517589 RepID=A0A5C4WMI4_9ACTN|nr:response regulator transcription factor [Nocardioides albidus]
MTIRVLIVDDQALVRAGFAAILNLEPDIEVVGEVADGSEALQVARATSPDVVLMDIRMPGTDGIAAIRALLEHGPVGVRVLMLTTFDLDEYLYEALRAGASGFLLKDVPRHQLLASVRAVATGDATLAPALLRRLVDDWLQQPRGGAGTTPGVDALTARGTRGVRADGAGTDERGDRLRALLERGDRAHPRVADLRQARCA